MTGKQQSSQVRARLKTQDTVETVTGELSELKHFHTQRLRQIRARQPLWMSEAHEEPADSLPASPAVHSDGLTARLHVAGTLSKVVIHAAQCAPLYNRSRLYWAGKPMGDLQKPCDDASEKAFDAWLAPSDRTLRQLADHAMRAVLPRFSPHTLEARMDIVELLAEGPERAAVFKVTDIQPVLAPQEGRSSTELYAELADFNNLTLPASEPPVLLAQAYFGRRRRTVRLTMNAVLPLLTSLLADCGEQRILLQEPDKVLLHRLMAEHQLLGTCETECDKSDEALTAAQTTFNRSATAAVASLARELRYPAIVRLEGALLAPEPRVLALAAGRCLPPEPAL